MTIKAINKTHQRAVTKLYKLVRDYYSIVDKDGTFDSDREQVANDRKEEKAFDKYQEVRVELPKREQLNFDKQHHAIHGYS